MKKPADIFNDDFFEKLDEDSSMSEDLRNASESAIIRFSEAYAIDPPACLKQSILEKLKSLQFAESNQQPLDISHLPILDETSNWLDWQTCIQDISPPSEFENAFLHPLETSPERELFIAWLKGVVEDEVHHDVVESFMILEGSCECSIVKADGHTHVVRLTVGDYLKIPIDEPHNIIVTSLQPVKAILQWKKVA